MLLICDSKLALNKSSVVILRSYRIVTLLPFVLPTSLSISSFSDRNSFTLHPQEKARLWYYTYKGKCLLSFSCVYCQANPMEPTSHHSWSGSISIREGLANRSLTNLKSLWYIREISWIHYMYWMRERYCFLGADRLELLKCDLRRLQFLIENHLRVTDQTFLGKVVPFIFETLSYYMLLLWCVKTLSVLKYERLLVQI